jgi:hypothetical protein
MVAKNHDLFQAVGVASAFRPILLAGIFSATLSSALASNNGHKACSKVSSLFDNFSPVIR